MVARLYLISSSFGGCQVKSRERQTKGDASVRGGFTACCRVIALIAWLTSPNWRACMLAGKHLITIANIIPFCNSFIDLKTSFTMFYKNNY